MAVKYVPFFPNTMEGQAILDNFVRTKRILRYRDNDQVIEHIERGMPLYEVDTIETVGENKDGNLIIRGECLSACAYLKEKGVEVDLVYIDPPFASGADYAKKIYVRRNPKIASVIAQAEKELEIEEYKEFEEKMYGDVWDKERYLNWMYDNLMAIKSVMSDKASIYVHIDWHIGHYVKILLDEVFGESCFKNEVIWYYYNKMPDKRKPLFTRSHDTILVYSKSQASESVFNLLTEKRSSPVKQLVRKKVNGKMVNARDEDGKILYRETDERIIDDVWRLPMLQPADKEEPVGYETQKPESLLERIISASSNPGMIVADFFGGSGVAAAVANRLGRHFIHADVNINSIQTTRDRLVSLKAEFEVLEIQDGVSLYRNPVQTMDKLKSLIEGLRNEDLLDKFWGGSIVDTKYGMMPVYLPNLMDGSTRLLDKPLMNRIIREALPELPEGTKRVIVYYIDVIDRGEIEKFIKEQNDRTTIEIELRDLKQILDNIVVEDEAEWHVEEVLETPKTAWKVTIDSFQSDRVLQKIDSINFKGKLQASQQIVKGKAKEFNPIIISNEGLETIEWLSLDCQTAKKEAPWHSDSEIKIQPLGYVILNGTKTQSFWDGTISAEKKPLRLRIRNICGDESVFVL